MGSGTSTEVRKQPDQVEVLQSAPRARSKYDVPICVNVNTETLLDLVLVALRTATQKHASNGPLCARCNMPIFYRIDGHPVFARCLCDPSHTQKFTPHSL